MRGEVPGPFSRVVGLVRCRVNSSEYYFAGVFVKISLFGVSYAFFTDMKRMSGINNLQEGLHGLMVPEVSARSGLASLFLECVDGNIVTQCHGKECFLLDTPPSGNQVSNTQTA